MAVIFLQGIQSALERHLLFPPVHMEGLYRSRYLSEQLSELRLYFLILMICALVKTAIPCRTERVIHGLSRLIAMGKFPFAILPKATSIAG